MVRAAVVILMVVGAVACGGEGGVGEEQVGEAVSDTSLMRDATAAANGIVRNQTDCEAVQSNLRDVNEKLDQIASQIQTAAGRTSLDALRRQVENIANACGAR